MSEESHGREKTVAARILTLAAELPRGSVLPEPAALGPELGVGANTAYTAVMSLGRQGDLLIGDAGWRISPQGRLGGRQSITRVAERHWLFCLPTQTRVRHFVVGVISGPAVAVFEANAQGVYLGSGARVSDDARHVHAVARGSYRAVQRAVEVSQQSAPHRTVNEAALRLRGSRAAGPNESTVTVHVAGRVPADHGWFAYWERGRTGESGGFVVVSVVSAEGADVLGALAEGAAEVPVRHDPGERAILVEPVDSHGTALDSPALRLLTEDRGWLGEISQGCVLAIEDAVRVLAARR